MGIILKQSFCFEVNGWFGTSCLVTLYTVLEWFTITTRYPAATGALASSKEDGVLTVSVYYWPDHSSNDVFP